jgi:two-component system chemotaxis response regulator CheY
VKTLLVDDEFASRTLLQGILSPFGPCHITVTGEEAVSAFQMAIADKSPYDLICMDIRMPGMGGIEATRRVRLIEEEHGILSTRGVKIVMATAVENPKEVMQSFGALCDGFFVKPIEGVELLAKLRELGLIG